VSFGPPVTPDVIKYLLIANVGVYLLQNLIAGVTELFALTPRLFWQSGALWQPVTYMWLHATGQGGFWHIAFNMFALWMFGSPVAALWGERRFLRFYLLCGIGAGLVIAAWPGLLVLAGVPTRPWFIQTLGASGAVFGVLLAYSMIWPDRTIMLLFPPIPLRAIWFIPFILVMELLTGPPNVSHVGHLGGVLVGFVLLRRMGITGGLSFERVKFRLRRWRMRRNLRAVQSEERRRWQNDDRTYH
jgi:membrane associated rhomboid family serine protease